jgi:hypothetical protein
MKSEESQCDLVNREIKEMNVTLFKIKQAEFKDLQRVKRVKSKVEQVISKNDLKDEELEDMNKALLFYLLPLDNISPSLFSIFVSKLKDEYEKSGSIRENLTKIIETIVTKEEFNFLTSDETFTSFLELCSLSKSEDIHLQALLEFMLSKNYITEKVIEAFKVMSVSTIQERMTRVCYDLNHYNLKFYVYK